MGCSQLLMRYETQSYVSREGYTSTRSIRTPLCAGPLFMNKQVVPTSVYKIDRSTKVCPCPFINKGLMLCLVSEAHSLPAFSTRILCVCDLDMLTTPSRMGYMKQWVFIFFRKHVCGAVMAHMLHPCQSINKGRSMRSTCF